MITRFQVVRLLQFRDGEYLVTSCYLNLDRAKMPPQMLKIHVKDLLQAGHQELAAKAGSHAQRESLRVDFALIEDFVMQEIVTGQHRGLAVFSCAGEKFWQTYRLPRMTRNILIADHMPYVRPLTALLDEHHRFCVVLADRAHGRIFEMYMGEIMERADAAPNVPRRVREGGLGGRDERHMERHHDHAVKQHFQQLADSIFDLFKRESFDWLVLGGHREVLPEFKRHLHPYLRQRWVGDFPAEPGKITPAEVLQQALEIEDRVEWEQERRMAEELVQKADSGNLAVSGLDRTLGALSRGEAQMLLVEDGFEQPGYFCASCHYSSPQAGDCPQCHKLLESCPDVVDEAISLALAKNCQIEHVRGPTPLRDAGHIGALLRYQT